MIKYARFSKNLSIWDFKLFTVKFPHNGGSSTVWPTWDTSAPANCYAATFILQIAAIPLRFAVNPFCHTLQNIQITSKKKSTNKRNIYIFFIRGSDKTKRAQIIQKY